MDWEVRVIKTTNRPMTAIALILALGFGASIALAQNPPPTAAPTVTPTVASVEPGALSHDQVVLLRQALDQASVQGFADKEFTPPGLDPLLASANPVEQRRGQVLLKSAVLRYAAAVHRGRLAISDFDDEWGMRPAAFDPAPGFEQALAQNQLPAWLASLPPVYDGYRQLAKFLAAYRDVAARGGWKTLPDGRVLKPGMRDPRVPALRARLTIEDASVPAAAPSVDVMDPPMVEALKVFQRRHGLKDDGELGKPTLAALNAPVGQRIQQIMANMERWRWLPEQLPANRVQVNIAAAMTTLVKDGKTVLTMKAAPGRPDDHTPMLQSQITAVVLNPPWNIPKSIADKEIYAKERAHPGYMEREDIHVIKTADGGERLQQSAGPKSSLGQVKFDFDNPYGVYLHDTPARAAFDRPGRMVSHGCVRLEKPRDLAALLLQGAGDWAPQTIDAAIAGGDTQRVALAQPFPVMLFYWTAFVGSDGGLNFTKDPYNWDQELMEKITGQKYSNA